MLNVMRENVGKLKWVLAVVAISMVGYLGAFFSDWGNDPQTGNWAAKVGDAPIPREAFIQSARQLDDYYSNLFGENYSTFKPQLRIGTAAIEQLIARKLIVQDAREMGLVATDDDKRRFIRENFVDESGNFVGAERYKQIVASRAPSAEQFHNTVIAEAVIVEKWSDLIAQSLDLSDDELRAIHRERTDKTVIDYFVVPAADQKVDSAVGEQELRAWFDAHQDDYFREEGRDIRFVVIDRKQQQDKVEVTQADVQAYYDSNQARYTHEEERRARHILLRVAPSDDKALIREAAERLLERVRGGDDFGELAKAMSQDPVSAEQGGDLGYFGRGRMVPPFEAAVFSTAVGEIAADVVESEFGFHVIEVTDAREAGVTPLVDVEEQIRGALKVQQAQQAVTALATRLQGDLTAGVSLEDLAKREGLTVQSRTVTRGERLSDLGAGPDFTGAVLELGPGESSAPLRIAAGLALVTVDSLVPAAVAPFDDVREQVRSDVLNDRAVRAAVAAARKAVGDAAGMASLAGRFGQEVTAAYSVGPGQTPPGTGGLTDELTAALFADGISVGDRGVAQVPAGALVYEVMERSTFDPADFQARKADLRKEVLEERATALEQSILDRLRKSTHVVIDSQLVSGIDG